MAFRMVPTAPVRINRPVRKVGPPVRVAPTISTGDPIGLGIDSDVDSDVDSDIDLDRVV
jgi:hypothetical protein